MTDRLNGGTARKHFTSHIRALTWARMAEEKGLPKHAKEWRKAHDEGWDDFHYVPLVGPA